MKLAIKVAGLNELGAAGRRNHRDLALTVTCNPCENGAQLAPRAHAVGSMTPLGRHPPLHRGS